MRYSRIASALVLAATVFGTLLLVPAGTAVAATSQVHRVVPAAPDGGTPKGQIRLTPIGRPTWKPVDLHLFSAEIGTATSGYAEFCETSQRILPPPDHVFNADFCVGPGKPHRPPYTKEIRHGVASLGLHQSGPFSADEFSNGKGVWLAFMTVPSPGVQGSSPDFKRGPIIPNTLFPITVTGSSTHNGRVYDSSLVDITVPKLDAALRPPFEVDGHSHFPVFIADSRDFAPPGDVKAAGRYSWSIDVVDQNDQGWRIDTGFVIAGKGIHS